MRWRRFSAGAAAPHRRRGAARPASPWPLRWCPGHPAPSLAAHVEFFFIGLAGLPVSLTPRETPHPPPPLALPKLASGLSGAPHAAGTPAPSPAAHAAFSLYWPVGLTGGGALRVTPHPAALPTLPKLASGLSGAPHAAGTPAPCPAAHVAFFFIGLSGLPAVVLYGKPRILPCRRRCQNRLLGLPAPLTPREIPHLPAPRRCVLLIGPFPVTGFLCKTFGTGEGKMRGKRGGKF